MSLPLATTTITVLRPALPATEDPYGDGYDAEVARDDDIATVETSVRAVISPAGAGLGGSSVGGESEVMEFRLVADPLDLSYLDLVIDETTDEEFEVVWAHLQPGLVGLDHMQAGLRTVKGRSQS